MVVAKWKTTMERLELNIHVKNSLIKIDEIQRHKGKLIVNWSTKMEETKPGFDLGENPTLLECYLASEQSEKLIINYRFKRNRPVCEPVQLLAKVMYTPGLDINYSAWSFIVGISREIMKFS